MSPAATHARLLKEGKKMRRRIVARYLLLIVAIPTITAFAQDTEKKVTEVSASPQSSPSKVPEVGTTSSTEPEELPDPVQTPTEGMEEITTPSGLKYIDIKVGDGEQPKRGAYAKVHFSGWLTDGTLIDTSVRLEKPREIWLLSMIEGWTEGISTMKVGGKRKLIIPPELGYGEKPSRKIPANSTLIYEIELIDVTQPPDPTPVDREPDAQKVYTLKIWDLTVGDGVELRPDGKIEMHYTLWREDGELYSTSRLKNISIKTGFDVLHSRGPGMAEGMLGMREGGIRRIEIPSGMAFGAVGIPDKVEPNVALVCEVELVDVITEEEEAADRIAKPPTAPPTVGPKPADKTDGKIAKPKEEKKTIK